MSAVSQRMRLALAAFYGTDGLVPALHELDRGGIVRRQIGVVALARTADGLCANSTDGSILAQLFHDLVSDTSTSVVGRRTMLSGPFWLQFAQLGGPSEGLALASRHIAPHLAAELFAQIGDGAVVLAISPATDEQQALCTRILLSHSSDRVQTHEFPM